MQVGQPYQELERRFAQIGKLRAVEGVLSWDTEVMMPAQAGGGRAEQLAALRSVIHGALTDPQIEELFQQVDSPALERWEQANLREMQWQVAHESAVPAELVSALAKAGTACCVAWRDARRQNDFMGLRPLLEQVVGLVRQVAQAKAQALALDPYDALLDEFEPGARASRLDALFGELGEFLPELTSRVLEQQAREGAPLPIEGRFDREKQRRLGLRVMHALGFNFSTGRVDVSTHPFCGGCEGDVRITTRYAEANFTESLMAVIHETGHALYEQGLPERWRYQPVGQARSMAMHESQSLLVEMQVSRSREFIEWLAPEAREVFGGKGSAWESANLYRHYHRVQRSLIRVDADELTYPLHVILRYRLERALVAGDLEVADLPAAWNDGMQELVGLRPPDDRQGCLQDIHWMDGTFGYFPTYTLGAMTAAQLYEAAVAADIEIPHAVSRGDFSGLLRWLRANVHQKGCSLATEDLLVEASGRALDVQIYRVNLERRYAQQA